MIRPTGSVSRYLILGSVLSLPLLLLAFSVLTWRELRAMRAVYLRNLAATLAARLETLPGEPVPDAAFRALSSEEPALADLRIYSQGQAPAAEPALAAIWSGRELFRTEEVSSAGRQLFRTYVPFHSQSKAYIARIDLAPDAGEFLVSHARHHTGIAMLTGVALLSLSFYALWLTRHSAALEKRRLELEHLAQVGTLAGVLAHEIRNPLGSIKGFAQLACERADPATAGLLQPALDEIRRLEKLVNDLLLYGRPPHPAARRTEWLTLAADLERSASGMIGDSAARWTSEGGAFQFDTDPDLLKEALLNLVRNAAEAVRGLDGGEIRLIASLAGQRVHIAVEDNGPGIPDAIRQRLFQPFTTSKASGTGLGLSISSKLVSSLGGTLTLLPAAPRGTRAEISLPATR
jgi:signal transduction histidine kinase